jgi:Tol biopolymer transport system component
MKMGKTWLWPTLGVIVAWSLGGCWAPENAAVKNEENVPPETGTVFRTGTWGSDSRGASNFAVSPDGTHIIFDTEDVKEGLLLLDLESGQKTRLPEGATRTWDMMGNWSPDGQQVVAVSTVIHDNPYPIGKQEIILIDPKNWRRYRKLATTPGVNINPFFSADGKSIYYFKGKKRKSGKTPAADYDLHVYDLALDREMRLTHEKMYMVSRGYDDGNEIFFTAYSIKRMPSINPLRISCTTFSSVIRSEKMAS